MKKVIVILVALAIIAGGAYLVHRNQDAIARKLGLTPANEQVASATTAPAQTATSAPTKAATVTPASTLNTGAGKQAAKATATQTPAPATTPTATPATNGTQNAGNNQQTAAATATPTPATTTPATADETFQVSWDEYLSQWIVGISDGSVALRAPGVGAQNIQPVSLTGSYETCQVVLTWHGATPLVQVQGMGTETFKTKVPAASTDSLSFVVKEGKLQRYIIIADGARVVMTITPERAQEIAAMAITWELNGCRYFGVRIAALTGGKEQEPETPEVEPIVLPYPQVEPEVIPFEEDPIDGDKESRPADPAEVEEYDIPRQERQPLDPTSHSDGFTYTDETAETAADPADPADPDPVDPDSEHSSAFTFSDAEDKENIGDSTSDDEGATTEVVPQIIW